MKRLLALVIAAVVLAACGIPNDSRPRDVAENERLQLADQKAPPQAASSAIQGPANILMQAPQQLASAPQQLSSMLSQFAGGFGSDLAHKARRCPPGSPAPARSRVSTRPE